MTDKTGADIELERIAGQIKTEYVKVQASERRNKEQIIAFGNMLIDAKDKAKAAGYKWGKWLEANCSIDHRQANRYMLAAKEEANRKAAEAAKAAGLPPPVKAAGGKGSGKGKGGKGGGIPTPTPTPASTDPASYVKGFCNHVKSMSADDKKVALGALISFMDASGWLPEQMQQAA
jgi:hypothetical protein